jgi:CheY-like chemotaxis protein
MHLGEILVNRLKGRTVLIVEDEWLVRMELVAAFEDEGCTVLESASAEDALAALHTQQPQGGQIELLVTDIRLSGTLSGWDLAARARSSDESMAVIYVSANPPSPDREVSGSIFIDKPALIGHVVAAARRLIG